MIAVIEIGGNQFTVKQGDVIEVKRQDMKVDDTMKVQALLVSDEKGDDVRVGTPFVNGAQVELKALEQFKDEKVRVFKMKSKKRFKSNQGFRAQLTKLEVLKIS
jgi:large subunit ribosomal protein L21